MQQTRVSDQRAEPAEAAVAAENIKTSTDEASKESTTLTNLYNS